MRFGDVYKKWIEFTHYLLIFCLSLVFSAVKEKYSNVLILDSETDSIQFTERDFINENHLNPYGAKKFTAIVNRAIDGAN